MSAKTAAANVSKIVAAIRATKNSETGMCQTNSKEVGKLIKARLELAFPGVKFSVKTDYNCVDIYWTNGPLGREVDAITSQYKFGGFDGMIDLAYHIDNWLLPDGSMSVASNRGTAGSKGSVPAENTDCPAPGAVMVSGGPRYVFTHHTIADEIWEKAVRATLAQYGAEWKDGRAYWDQELPHGDRVCSHLNRHPEQLQKLLAEAV